MNTTGIIGHDRQLKVLSLLLKNGNTPHSMLFSGKRGIGKRLIARRFLAALFCAAGEPPCGACPSCLQAAGGTHPDIIELAPDEKGTIPIGDADRSEPGTVRWLINRLSKKSVSGKFGVMIDGAEAIKTEGQNALLKTIEEPQAGARIIIITSNKSLILPTILSRSLDMAFSTLSLDQVKGVLAAAGSGADPGLAAALSGGSVETALALSDEAVLDGIGGICGEISSYLSRGDSLKLDLAALQKKIGIDQVLSVLLTAYRALLLPDFGGAPAHPALSAYDVTDRHKLVKLIKILLALRKGLANNLNIRNALKGMLYAIDGIDGYGLPAPDKTE
jgi:DNA polymerase III subunit delta'